MINTDYTLGDFFKIDRNVITTDERKKLTAEGWLGEIDKKAGRKLPGGVMLDTILDKTGELLDIELSTILVRGWVRWHKVRKQFRDAVSKPDQTILIPLFEHKLMSTHKPHIDVFLNGEPIGRIDVSVALTANIKGVSLKVEHGKITEIHTGTCVADGKISIEGVKIVEEQSRPIELPGSIRLDKPVDLRRIMDEPEVIGTARQVLAES